MPAGSGAAGDQEIFRSNDDSGAFDVGASPPVPKAELPKIQQLSEFGKQMNKFTGVVTGSAICSLLRLFMNPPKPPIQQEASKLPTWFQEEYKKQYALNNYGRQYIRDTAALVSASYLMDFVTSAMHTIRGADDAGNKMLGGLSAGSFLGFVWYSGQPTGRVFMSLLGAMVGFFSFQADSTAKIVLLQNQRKLEKEVLHKSDTELKSTPDPDYLRQLILLKRQQMAQQQQTAAEANGGQPPTLPGLRSLAGPPGQAPTGAAGAPAGGPADSFLPKEWSLPGMGSAGAAPGSFLPREPAPAGAGGTSGGPFPPRDEHQQQLPGSGLAAGAAPYGGLGGGIGGASEGQSAGTLIISDDNQAQQMQAQEALAQPAKPARRRWW